MTARKSAVVRLILLLWAGCFTGLGVGHAAGAESGDTVAVVEGTAITVSDFKTEMERRGRMVPGNYGNEAEREALLWDMVGNELLYRAALKAGYDKKPEILESIKRSIINGYKQEALEPELAKISVTEDEIRAYYQARQQQFETPGGVRAAVIKIEVPARVSEEKRGLLLKRAAEAREEALRFGPAVASFGGVAVKYSDHQPSRYRGGDIGFLKKGDQEFIWPEEVLDTIFSLKVQGEISPVIATQAGYYIVKLMESKDGKVRSLEEIKEEVRHRVISEKKRAIESAFFTRLKEQSSVILRPEHLKSITPAEVPKPEPPSLPASVRRR
ncbi:MAG: peptidyl-prolyl cis-trans isomerase [Nitrospirae bacterium]|nr:peptidyl-prolyl cis-trans isomerase [Nitrospirota bacterium]